MTQLPTLGVTEKRGMPVVSSRHVAEVFNREHKNVLQSVRTAISETENFAANFSAVNFIENQYKERGKFYSEYLLTKDGFSYIVMGFTGKKASKFKVVYIEQFNRMERLIQSLTAAKLDHPEFTKAIMSAHEEPKHYHFSNESDMINRIVLGMSAKKFKESNNLGNVPSIRPHLTPEQIDAIEKLQRFDIGLILVQPEFDKRKQTLTEYYNKLTTPKLLVKGMSA